MIYRGKRGLERVQDGNVNVKNFADPSVSERHLLTECPKFCVEYKEGER